VGGGVVGFVGGVVGEVVGEVVVVGIYQVYYSAFT